MTFSKLYIPESQKQRLMWSSNSGKTKPKNYGTGSSNLASSTSRDIERPMPSIGDPAVGSKQRRKLALSSAHVRDEAQLASRGKRKMEALRILAADALWKMETREEGKSAGSIQMDARPRKKKGTMARELHRWCVKEWSPDYSIDEVDDSLCHWSAWATSCPASLFCSMEIEEEANRKEANQVNRDSNKWVI